MHNFVRKSQKCYLRKLNKLNGSLRILKKGVMKMDNSSVGIRWEDVQKELFTPEDIAISHLKAALIGELIRARRELGLSQRKLEEMSGVKQPVIARMELGETNPKIDTVIKLLVPLGKTLAIVPLPTNE